MEPPVLKASPLSRMEIKIVLKNSFGFATPFAKADVRFETTESANLIELEHFIENDRVIVHSKGIEGEATVGIYSLKTGILLKQLLIKIVAGDYTLK